MVEVVSMDRDKVNRLAGILQQASEVLRSIDEPRVSTTSSNNNSTTSTRTSTDSAAPSRIAGVVQPRLHRPPFPPAIRSPKPYLELGVIFIYFGRK